MQEREDFFARHFAHRASRGEPFFREIVLSDHHHAAGRFSMLPDQRVGLAVRRIRRRETKRNFLPVWHESAGFLRAMSRAAIDDQEDFAPAVLDWALQEFDQESDEASGVDAALAR